MLQERLETMVNIELLIQSTPPSSAAGTGAGYRSPENMRRQSQKASTPPSLPIGIGQVLDDMLIKGEMNVDDYVLKMSKLADDASESLGQ